MTIAQNIIAELKRESVATRKLLERVPDEHLEWKPHEKSMSTGDLASHIVDSFTWLGNIIGQDELQFDPQTWTPWKMSSNDDLLSTFDKNVSDAAALLEDVTDESMMGMWKMTIGGATMMESPRVGVVKMFAVNHHIHHRAQLGVYLRMKDVPLPQTYGPSADETDMGG
jgi:uncharacterized damage-inducible protein DinB